MSRYIASLSTYKTLLPFEKKEFKTIDGTILRGNFYKANTPSSTGPVVIFVHGLGLLKEQYLENWYKYVLAAGYHVFTYDHRSFGDSEGTPRDLFDWHQQSEDFIDAVTFVRGLDAVDENKVFTWGVAHAGGLIGMAAAKDKRLAGIIMFLPCIDGAWDKSAWGTALAEQSEKHRFQQTNSDASNTIQFWPVPKSTNRILSGEYVEQWTSVAQQMAEQAGKKFTGQLHLSSIWNDYHCWPLDVFDDIAPVPLLWIMATEDVVCGPLEWQRREYDKLSEPKELLVLEGEHLPQYFGTGFERSTEAILAFLDKYSQRP